MKLLTSAGQRELDRRAGEAGLPIRVLMESAGAAVAREVLALHPRRVFVFCGPGNNGGDGYVAARLLSASVETICLPTATLTAAATCRAASALLRETDC